MECTSDKPFPNQPSLQFAPTALNDQVHLAQQQFWLNASLAPNYHWCKTIVGVTVLVNPQPSNTQEKSSKTTPNTQQLQFLLVPARKANINSVNR
jgi:hypothetical protein